MKNLYKISAVLLFGVILIGSNTTSAQQKSNPAVTISPFLQSVRFASEDTSKSFTVNVTNNSSVDQNLKITALDFGSLNDTGGVVFAGSSASSLLKKYGLATWMQLDAGSLTLGPGKSSDIKATIVNDASLTPGGHYAAIVVSVDGQSSDDSNLVTINQKLSALVMATKVGGEKYDLILKSIDAKTGKFSLPKSTTLTFTNPGNVHVVPRGTVKLLNSGGKVIEQGVINEESAFVLPETSRKIVVDFHSVSKPSLWPSRYILRADYRYDDYENYARKEQVVYFFNFTGILILVSLLIVAIFIIIKFKNLQRKPKIANTTEIK